LYYEGLDVYSFPGASDYSPSMRLTHSQRHTNIGMGHG